MTAPLTEREALLAQLAKDWERQIISAGGDENVAQQAVALAALNGLFDHVGNAQTIGWQPIETAPVEHYAKVQSWYRFRCLLQTTSEVFEGYGRYVKLGRATPTMTLRWYHANDRQCFPKLWMPLPAASPLSPSRQEGGGVPKTKYCEHDAPLGSCTICHMWSQVSTKLRASE
jgi:hypothetical protein